MSSVVLDPVETGLEVIDLQDDREFAARRIHVRDAATQTEGIRRLAHAFVERPETILQELANAAVELCEADSSGISVERESGDDANFTTGWRRPGSTGGFWMRFCRDIRAHAVSAWNAGGHSCFVSRKSSLTCWASRPRW